MKKVVLLIIILFSFAYVFTAHAGERELLSVVVENAADIISVTDVTDKNNAVVFVGDFIISYKATTEEVTVLVVDNTTNAVYEKSYSASSVEYEKLYAVLAYNAAYKKALMGQVRF